MNESVAPLLKILVVRADRLGDVVLSTPVFAVLKRHYPRSHLTVMVRESVAPVIRGLHGVDDVMIFDPDRAHAGAGGFFRLISEIRARNFRIGIVLQSQWRIAAALFGAGVRYRVGPLSKLHSFFFYNRGIRQRRSQVEMHETDYNLQLLRRLGIRVSTRSVPTQVNIGDEARMKAKAWLDEQGWNPHTEDVPLVAVHPGMGGSALNWPETHYVDLIRSLLKDGNQVVVTGGPSEASILDKIREELGPLKNKAYYYGGAQAGQIDELGALLSWVTLMVAPSTGPLHLAVALGKPVVCFYPPVRVQSAVRWGPYRSDESRSSVLVPEMYCGEDFECRGNLCNYFPCMKSLQVSQALEQVRLQISNARAPRISPDPEETVV